MKDEIHIVYYITAHGYGHGVRSCDVLRALLRRHPRVRVTVVSGLPEPFLRNRLQGEGAGRVAFRKGMFDVGMVQKDSIRVDVAATRERLEAMLKGRGQCVREEKAFLQKSGAVLAVADIPSIPLEAAAAAGIPRVAIGNFSWDWIYRPFVERDGRWAEVCEVFQEGYRQADVLYQLPFSPEMEVFARRWRLPLLASPGIRRRKDLAALTGADAGKKWVLLSFTTLEWGERALQEVERLEGVEFFTVAPLEWPGRRGMYTVDRERMGFADVLASVDVVVTKPGYGILSECAVSGMPMIYVEREDFAEYPLLERELKRYLRNVHLRAEDLYAGRLAGALEAMDRAAAPKERLEGGGAELAADDLFDRAAGT